MTAENVDLLVGELEQSFWVTICLMNTGCKWERVKWRRMYVRV